MGPGKKPKSCKKGKKMFEAPYKAHKAKYGSNKKMKSTNKKKY